VGPVKWQKKISYISWGISTGTNGDKRNPSTRSSVRIEIKLNESTCFHSFLSGDTKNDLSINKLKILL
jgi:hypothetical protein